MLHAILTETQSQLLRDERSALAEVRLALAALETPRQSLDAVQQAILQLDELFLLVVVGEFNAGKSALVNALLGQPVLAEGLTPTTSRVTLVRWGEAVAETVVDEDFATLTHSLPLLRELNIVDTPGTNAVIRRHERLTNEFVPRSDLVLFVTSVDRPMTESERLFLERLRAWGKKVVIVLNKTDLLDPGPEPGAEAPAGPATQSRHQAELQLVVGFVLKHATEALGFTPLIFPVSARLAQRANAAAPDQAGRLRQVSGMDALSTYIDETLDDQERLRLKLANPLGVTGHIIEQARVAADEQAAALNEDNDTVAAVEIALAAYESELASELPPRLAQVENIMHRLQARGLDFFDSTIRLTRILDLARGDKVRAEFEREVLADVPRQIEERVHDVIDWLVDKDLHQWQQIMSYLQRRQARYSEHMVGATAAPLDSRRRALIDSVGKSAQVIVDTYDRDAESSALAAHVEAAVAQVALLEAGAVGLGALVTFAIASSTADITGLLAAGTLAIVGLFVIPYKRKQAKARFTEKMDDLRTRLLGALRTQFTGEAENATVRMKDTVAPYTRFVRAERQRIQQAQDSLDALRKQVAALKARVDLVCFDKHAIANTNSGRKTS
jgi:small GTP-binding protein